MSEGGAPLNATGPGIAGITGDPPGGKNILMRLKRKKPQITEEPKEHHSEKELFAGHPVFLVGGDDFEKARLGKLDPHRYSRYTGDEEIRQYGLNNPGKPILLKHRDTGAIQFLKYGRSERKF